MPSEFTGETRKNTLPAKPKSAPLSPSEKLRLMYLTGQDDDVTVDPAPEYFRGEVP